MLKGRVLQKEPKKVPLFQTKKIMPAQQRPTKKTVAHSLLQKSGSLLRNPVDLLWQDVMAAIDCFPTT
jgi:hypothetical protein